MATKIEEFNKLQLKNDLPDIRPGDTIQVYQRVLPVVIIGEKRKSNKKQDEVKEKEKIQIFEGLVLAIKHGKGVNATITVRRVVHGFGVEKIFPIHSPLIQKINIVKRVKVRRAKLYYLREAKGKRARLQAIDLPEEKTTEAPKEKSKETPKPEAENKPEVKEEVKPKKDEKPEVKAKDEKKPKEETEK